MVSARLTTASPAPATSVAQAALWHLLGGSGAPRTGDVRAWKALLETTRMSVARPGGSNLMDGGAQQGNTNECYLACLWLSTQHTHTTHKPPRLQGDFWSLDPPVTIEAVDAGDSGRLPVAHTCGRSLGLPEYLSKEVLKERLALAIAHVEEEFGLA